MELLLKDKVAIVTGAGRGIGEAIVMEFVKWGASVVVTDINFENAKAVAKKAESLGAKSLAMKLDVADKEDVKSCIEKTMDSFGKIDILVNNAGIGKNTQIEDITEEEWDEIHNINLKGVFLCSQAVYPIMKAQKYGKIVNVASLAGEMGSGTGTGVHYGSTKGGVISMTKSFASYGAQYSVYANAIAPGITVTELALGLGVIKNENDLNDGIPLPRLGQPKDIANAAVFLASSLSDFMTGGTIDVNGGMYMR